MRTIQARRKLGPQGTMRRSLADVLRDAKHCIEALESRDMDGLGTELENLKADVAVVQGVFEELHAATLKV